MDLYIAVMITALSLVVSKKFLYNSKITKETPTGTLRWGIFIVQDTM